MQGSYKNNGLPRPYYMKPNRRGSAYNNVNNLFFLTNSRKLTGYLVMLVLFGLCMFMVAQELKAKPEPTFEIMDSLEVKGGKNLGDVGNLVDSADKKDKNFEKPQVAVNKAQNSRGEYGHAVLEAPKGGLVNEGPVVGNDEGLVVDGKTKKIPANDASYGGSKPNAAVGSDRNGVKALRNGEDTKKLPLPSGPDLLKLNEINEKSDNVKGKVKDTAPGQEEDTSVDESGQKIVDPKAKKIIDNRMHQKVEEMNKQEGEEKDVKKDLKGDKEVLEDEKTTEKTDKDGKDVKAKAEVKTDKEVKVEKAKKADIDLETKDVKGKDSVKDSKAEAKANIKADTKAKEVGKESNPQAAEEHYANAIGDEEEGGKSEKKAKKAYFDDEIPTKGKNSGTEPVTNKDLKLKDEKDTVASAKAKKSEDDDVVKKAEVSKD